MNSFVIRDRIFRCGIVAIISILGNAILYSVCTALGLPDHILIWRVHEFILIISFFIVVLCGVFFWAYAWVRFLAFRKGNLRMETELVMLVGTLAFGYAVGVYWHLTDRKRQGENQPHPDDDR